jgi:uncharacterized membrane protein
MNRNLVTLLGFILFLVGFISIVLSLVGLELSILKFTNYFGKLGSLIIKIIMIFGGMAIFYIARTDLLNDEN